MFKLKCNGFDLEYVLCAGYVDLDTARLYPFQLGKKGQNSLIKVCQMNLLVHEKLGHVTVSNILNYLKVDNCLICEEKNEVARGKSLLELWDTPFLPA